MRLARGEGKEGLGQLTDPGGGDRDDGPRARGDADGGIGRGPASAVHRAAAAFALEREGARSREGSVSVRCFLGNPFFHPKNSRLVRIASWSH